MMSMLTGVSWCLILVLTCISLIIAMLNIFSCACWLSVCLLWKNVYLGLLSNFWLGFFLILSSMSRLYILRIKPLSVTSFPNIFSHSGGCLFILFMVSFAVQKLICLIRPHLFIFAFISFALGDWPKKTLLWFMSEMFSLCSLQEFYGVVSYI